MARIPDLCGRPTGAVSFATRRNEARLIVRQRLDGSAAPEDLVNGRNTVWPGAWMPDGQALIYVEDPPTSLTVLNLLWLPVGGEPEPLVGPVHFQPSLSPDGKWMAYASGEGRPQIFLRQVAGGAPRQVTADGGGQPRWSRDGRELFFRRVSDSLRISIETTPVLRVGKPERLFTEELPPGNLFRPQNYDVAPDGKRFLMIRPADTERQPPTVTIVMNWFSELERRVPIR